MPILCHDLYVSRETISKLELFQGLVVKWTEKINLIAPSTIPQIWKRHIVDSAQLFRIAPQGFGHWVDIGSGGGFPGVVIAVLAQEISPKSKITLIESDLRKCAFLRQASVSLDTHFQILPMRIENTEPQSADVVTARALGSLRKILPEVNRLLSDRGEAILLKGRKYKEEISEARRDWTFELTENVSITDPEARILSLKRIARV